MIWEIDLTVVTSWYWVLIAVILGVSIYGSWKHNTAIPILWGGLMSVILYYGAVAIEPLIFGFEHYPEYTIQWYFVTAFGVLFALINATYLYNIATKGTVVE